MAKGKSGFYLEGGKFAVYMIIPLGISWYYSDPIRQKAAVDYWKFVQYPANPSVNIREQVLELQKQEQQRQVYRNQLRNLQKQADKTITTCTTTASTTSAAAKKTINNNSSNDNKNNEEKKSWWRRWIGLG
jgi:Pet100